MDLIQKELIIVGGGPAGYAAAIRAADANAYVIGGVISKDLAFLNTALGAGMAGAVNAVSYHAYVRDDAEMAARARAIRGLCDLYDPAIEVVQGESGTQSRNDGNGALRHGNWTPWRQAKYLLRHLVTDLAAGVKFTSYFSCMDMIEALNGTTDNKASYLDYGYFGVLGADFDENGFSTGDYTPKPSYYALQNLAALLGDGGEVIDLPVRPWPQPVAKMWLTPDVRPAEMTQVGFRLANGGAALAFWVPTDVTTTDYEGTVSLQLALRPGTPVRLLDPMDGSVYEFTEAAAQRDAHGNVLLTHIDIRDYPLFLIIGDLPDLQ